MKVNGLTGSVVSAFCVKMNPMEHSAYEILDNKKIFFGHQSVGGNIISGIRLLQSARPEIKFNILETKDFSLSVAGCFAHYLVGKNKDPQSKTREFANIIESNRDNLPDIALHKYCYVDISATSDIKGIFNEYSKYMSDLTQRFPHVNFAHCTIPLTTIQKGPKAWAKRLLNKKPYGIDDNIARNEYNMRLRDSYEHTGLIFDLAEHEAKQLNGGHTHFSLNNKQYMCLNDTYTDDGGHLNVVGQQYIADKFLSFLCVIAKE